MVGDKPIGVSVSIGWQSDGTADAQVNTLSVARYTDYGVTDVPPPPPEGKIRVFVDSAAQRVRMIKPDGSVIDLGATPHNLLDSGQHPDTESVAVQRGMIIAGKVVGNTVKWGGIPLGAAGKVLKSTGTDVSWGGVLWDEIENKPLTFPPQAHTHTKADITDFAHTHPLSELQQSGAAAGQVPKWNGTQWVASNIDWSEIVNKPVTFPPSAHTHTKADITDFAHTHSLSDLTQSGAQANQVPKWSGTAWVAGNVDWAEIINKPATFPPSPHTHDASEIASGRLSLSRLPTSAAANRFLIVRTAGADPVYDAITAADLPAHTHTLSQLEQSGAQVNQVPKWSGTSWVAGNINWNEVQNKPTTFTPSVHGREAHGYNLLPNTAPATPNEGDIWYDASAGQKKLRYRDDTATRTVNDWNDIFNKPATFPPSAHTHPLSDLQQSGASAGQVPKWSGTQWVAGNVDWNEIVNKPATFPPSAHTHTKSEITDFAHTHPLSELQQSGATLSQVVKWNGTQWAAGNVDWAEITNKPATFPPSAHAASHQHGGSDEIATATPTAYGIPKAGGDGKLDSNWISDNLRTTTIGITIGDGVNPITTGVKGAIYVPVSGTITEWVILSTDGLPPTSGSIQFDILKSTYANYPTMSSIIGTGTPPSVTNAVKAQGTPTGWVTTQINAGDCIAFQVTSASGFKRVTLTLRVIKS